jgi:hypothetical protein
MSKLDDERRFATHSGVESGPDMRPVIWGVPEEKYLERQKVASEQEPTEQDIEQIARSPDLAAACLAYVNAYQNSQPFDAPRRNIVRTVYALIAALADKEPRP